LKSLLSLLSRHAQAFWYVITVVLPVILRTGRRPVIFSKYSGIGDIICTFPAALELKRRHPQATFIYNCHPGFACLPRLGGVATRVTSLLPIGLVGHWYGFLLAGFYHFDSDDDHPDVVPTEVYIKDFGRQFGLMLDDHHPRLQNDPADVSRVKALLAKHGLPPGPMVLIHPGPSWPVREWPEESWAALVRELRRHGCTNIVQLGTSHHLALGAVGAAALPEVLSLVDQLTLAETVALISLGNLFVGIDSGLLHIAVAVQTPAVGLWGPTSAHLRFSRASARSFVTSNVECQGCHHRVPRLHWMTGCPYDIRCMKTISVTDVLSACLTRLSSAKPGQTPQP
jgi:ADP-heptose:LPS heptosyltransferase